MTDRIVELIREYGCNPDELDVFKVAQEIREIARREQLKEMGYSRACIAKMTPVEAYEIFGKPLPIPKAEREIVMEELKLTKSDQSWQDPLVKRFFTNAEDMEYYWLDKA